MDIIHPERLEQAINLPVMQGAHNEADHEFCIMEMVAWVQGQPHTDHPQCVSPVIGAFLRNYNDRMPNNERREFLKYLIPVVVGSKSDELTELYRGFLMAAWANKYFNKKNAAAYDAYAAAAYAATAATAAAYAADAYDAYADATAAAAAYAATAAAYAADAYDAYAYAATAAAAAYAADADATAAAAYAAASSYTTNESLIIDLIQSLCSLTSTGQ